MHVKDNLVNDIENMHGECLWKVSCLRSFYHRAILSRFYTLFRFSPDNVESG